MDNKTLVALEESIDDWKKKARGIKVDRECPLCVLGWKRGTPLERHKCWNCIIKERTGQYECHGSPFWNKGSTRYELNMVEYLESFLPQKKEEVKMKFVIKDSNQRKENVKVELSLENGSDGFVKIYASSKGENRKILMTFKDGKFRRCWGAQTEGVNTNTHGQIIEKEGV